MKKRFSTLLLTGKAATLPMLLQHAQAMTPTFQDVTRPELTVVQLPVEGQVQLDALGGGNSPYGPTSGMATLCTTQGAFSANEMSLVVTGLRGNEDLYVFASGTGGASMEVIDSRLKLREERLTALLVAPVSVPEGHASLTLSFPLERLVQAGLLGPGSGSFYLQALVAPAGVVEFAQVRFSELDVIGAGVCSTYGSGGGTYG